MSKVFCDISTSLDGYVTGLNQRLDAPFGDGPARAELHRWALEAAEENAVERERVIDAGAFIMGRNMFDPHRGAWDPEWTGWWGAEPPYHGPVFVLTHHERDDLVMDGGTTFHFVTGGITEALDRAKAAAGDRWVSIAGGASTANQYLGAGLVDELRLHIAPYVLGAGERLFTGVRPFGLTPVEVRHTAATTHVRYVIGS
ncbi:dihydrofolate reductase family protein [Actinokineospora globicatena]|uniref:DNA-binding protein n=1 Tax=Actinokineospora globicatena TaxID=103729 RepID=A0A9W6QRR8_9PSEU|nr:dihydrofolate reductase family protein [Actinokineospora globicatena]MCP2305898.1 Dihydrofolate reductase [Actinokineospora globicatena]GLW80233.1 DNA-binding protein [Actinokineospora globicatena]GLW87062.1 DNA-binding protein [Actinokineospora globicatena]GLW93427.1 DNA-binding protein [Actinokineospora globicatena]